jgi:hypothetical protein
MIYGGVRATLFAVAGREPSLGGEHRADGASSVYPG